MNLERLRWGEWIAGIAALDLLLVTFRAWYKVSGGDGRVSAWDALESGRYLLIATAVVGLLLLLLAASEQAAQMSFPPGGLAAVVGLACTVYIAYRLATPPADTLDADLGLYFGLASALGVAIGGLLSARDALPARDTSPGGAHAAPGTQAASGASGAVSATYTGPTSGGAAPLGALVPDSASSGGWSPAPASSGPGWSPAAAPAPPATAAGAGFAASADRPIQPGDDVALTAGGARFPAGTIARVIEVFGGGALVEVAAPDGVGERFEVPEEAYERLTPGAAVPAAGESWTPAMPAPAGSGAGGEDWGFDESSGAAAGTAVADDESAAEQTREKKVPFWKREIGGKKKGGDGEVDLAEAGAASALGAAAIGATDVAEERPGFFKRMFGGGKKDDDAGEDTTQAFDDVGDSGSDGAEAEAVIPEPESSAPEPESSAPEPEPVASEPEPEPPAPEPEPEPPAPEPEVLIDSTTEPEPEPPAPEPEPEPEPPAPEPEPEPPAPEPEPEPAAEADAAAGAAAAASADTADADAEGEKPKPKRKRSSGSRKVPKEALAAAAGEDAAPKVGDAVALKVSGGKFDAGTTGTVVDVFSAGVIVELTDNEGRTERLDLPFEAVGPADA